MIGRAGKQALREILGGGYLEGDSLGDGEEEHQESWHQEE